MTGKFRVKKIFYGLGAPSVGLAQEYVVEGINTVTILERWKSDRNGHVDGELKMPGTFQILGKDIRKHPLKQYSGVPPQYFVPTDALFKPPELLPDQTPAPAPQIQGRLLDVPIVRKRMI